MRHKPETEHVIVVQSEAEKLCSDNDSDIGYESDFKNSPINDERRRLRQESLDPVSKTNPWD